MPSPDAAKLKRLSNLLKRGRSLHFDNARLLYKRATGASASNAMPPLADLVLRGAQLGVALIFLEDRGYLHDADYDAFTDALFAEVASGDDERLLPMVHNYGAAASQGRLGSVFADDLAASFRGGAKLSAAFARSGDSVSKTTRLYVAMTFNDRAMVARLQ